MAFAQAGAVFVRGVATWFVGSVPIGALRASEVTDGACDVACFEARLGLAVCLDQMAGSCACKYVPGGASRCVKQLPDPQCVCVHVL